MAKGLRSLDEVKVLPLWKTDVMIEIKHLHTDSEYVEIIAGVLGNITWNANQFDVCVGGKGSHGEGRWVDVRSSTHRRVSVFEL